MSTIIIIVLVIAAIVLLYGISVYNRFVKFRTTVDEAWSGINVQLKKRHDLIPNLMETVKGYAVHERDTLDSVTQARTNAMQANNVSAQEVAEGQLSTSLARLMAVAESYPDLKANQNFMHLQEELGRIESDIEKSRRYYNGAVRQNNIAIDVFPSNIVAGMFKFSKSPFFELDNESEKAVPQIKF